jgi:hypothetical protein
MPHDVKPDPPLSTRASLDPGVKQVERPARMGGTCSGEHGVGLHKIVHMET